MAVASPEARGGPGVVHGVAAVVVVLVVVVAATVYAMALIDGVSPVTRPLFVVADAACAIIVAYAAWVGAGRGHGRVAGWLAALAASLAGYLVVVAAATATSATGGLAASVVVALEGSWYVVVMTVASLVSIIAIEEVTESPRRLQLWSRLIGGLAAAALLLSLGADRGDAYPGISAPLAGTVLGSDIGLLVSSIATVAWQISTVAAPILAWRHAASAARLDAGRVRQRLTIVAIGAATPAVTLLTCLLLFVAASAGLLSIETGSTILSLVFCVPLVVLVAAVAAGVTASGDATAASLRASIRWALSGLWILVGSQLVVLGASLVARGAGHEDLVVATGIAVIATASFVAAYRPVARRLLAFAGVDVRSDASGQPLTDVLTPRERDVLERIARGRSNSAVAAELHLSERTVDSHVTAIFDKLGLDRSTDVNRRVQAAAAWIRAEQNDASSLSSGHGS